MKVREPGVVAEVGARSRIAPRNRLILSICCVSLLMGGMDATIVNLGLPAIQADLHTSLTDLQWILDAYVVGVASLLMLSGVMGDRFGRRRVFQIGLAVFTTASALCGLSPSLGWLLACRVLQAIGASMLNPLALSIITSVFTERSSRTWALGIWSGVNGVSLGIGPLVGGVLIGSVGWRTIFWINVPIGLAALLLTALFVPESRAAEPRHPDLVGQALLASLLAGLAFAIIEAPRSGWLSARADVAGGLATIAAIAFVPYELRHRQPVIDLRLFRSSRFSGCMVIAFTSTASFAGFELLASLYLQQVRGRSPIVAGGYLAPMGVLAAVCAPICGRMLARTGARRPLILAGGLLAGGGALMAFPVIRESDPLLLLTFAVFSAGYGFVNAPVNYTAVSAMPSERASLAAATASTSRLVGAALGIAAVGSVLAAGSSGPLANNFASASGPCWAIIAGCGLVVLAVGSLATR